MLKAIMSGDGEAILDLAALILSVPIIDAEALFGTKCSDASDPTTDLANILPILEDRHSKSRIAGDTGDHFVARCAGWKLPAKERYGGDFHVKMEKPVLVIGNTYNPVTPLASARNVSESFENAVLLQNDGYGVSVSPLKRYMKQEVVANIGPL
jgi:hypothetical protein